MAGKVIRSRRTDAETQNNSTRANDQTVAKQAQEMLPIIHEGKAGAPERTRLWATIETPMAILSAGSIAATAADPDSRLEVLVMGLNDLVKETRVRLTPGRPAALAWLSMCVVAARAHGCDIIDGVYNDFNDPAGFKA